MILSSLRKEMVKRGFKAYIIGCGDAHLSEYIAASDKRLPFVSGFTGSNGNAVITHEKALLWTDGRYFLQAQNQLTEGWSLMKMGIDVAMDDWLLENCAEGTVVAVDPSLMSAASAKSMEEKFKGKEIVLSPDTDRIVDAVWGTERPAMPSNPVAVHPLALAGVSVEKKLQDVRDELVKNNCDGVIISALDEICWLFNIRGSDIPFNPVVFAYAIVTRNRAILFTDMNRVGSQVKEHFGALVELMPYGAIDETIKSLPGCIMADTNQLNWHLANVAGKQLRDKPSILALPKAIKNEAELNGIRHAHVVDGIALTAFLHKLTQVVAVAHETITECEASDLLETYREKMPGHVGPSFETIAGYGPNGAIIHYKPEKETCAKIGRDTLFLLDSGAQFVDGTTDVTRTVCFGTPSEEEKEAYTLVLKGHISFDSVVFPETTLGSRIDALARTALWSFGLDYQHGTGHGVGAYLNVHEGPQGVGYRKRANEVGFRIGMTISNEPGYYKEGAFGIRIENVDACVAKTTKYGENFCGFEPLTMVPISTKLVKRELLTPSEISWLNNYNATVRANISEGIQVYFPEAYDYLIQETEPI